MSLGDEVFQHRLRDLEFGDHPVADGPDGDDVCRGAAGQFFGLCAYGNRAARLFVNDDPRRLVYDNALIADVNQRVGRAQVNADVE